MGRLQEVGKERPLRLQDAHVDRIQHASPSEISSLSKQHDEGTTYD